MLVKESTTKKSQLDHFHKILDEEEKKTMLIVAKVENIYMNIKEESSYFIYMRWIIFSIIFTCSLSAWVNFLTVGEIKNNSYCFDKSSLHFKICVVSSYTEDLRGVHNLIFTSFENNQDTIVELNMVNAKYRKFFIKDSIYYTLKNYNTIDKFKKPSDNYKTVVIVTSREGYNFNILLKIKSGDSFITIFSAFSLLGFFSSNLLANFLADVINNNLI